VPKLHADAGGIALVLLAVGGVLYTAGAVVYARRQPDPLPAIFGYHELFHALVVAAALCQYGAVAFVVL
jgi:hemolysin III